MSIQWPLLLFSVFSGTASGMLVYLGICELRKRDLNARFAIAIIALILLAAGGCASTLHLGHPERALHIMGNMGSGLSRELIAVGVTGVIAIAYAIAARKSAARALKAFGACGLAAGVVLPLVAGASYMMAARPVWDSIALPLMFLGTGIGLGLVLAVVVGAAKGGRGDLLAEDATIALVGIAAAAVSTVVFVAWIAIAPYPDPSRSVMRLMVGDLAPLFWLGVVVIGVIAPVALGVAVRKVEEMQEQMRMLAASFACLLVGSVALRMIMYLVATSVEQLIY